MSGCASETPRSTRPTRTRSTWKGAPAEPKRFPEEPLRVDLRPSVLRRAGERPAVDPDRRHEHPAEVPADRPPLAADRDRPGESGEVALGEAQVPDRPDDLPALDEER